MRIVLRVHRNLLTPEMEKNIVLREKYIRKYEKEKFLFAYNGKKGTTKDGWMELSGNEVDSATFYKEKIMETEIEIEKLRKKDKPQTCVAFITFDSIYGQVVCSSSLISSNVDTWKTTRGKFYIFNILIF